MSHYFSLFTRSRYDNCTQKQKEQESTSPFAWTTDSSVVESNESCFQGSAPFQHNPYKSIPKDSIDLESELKGQTRNLSKCIQSQYNPNLNKTVPKETLKECQSNALVPEYTRINKPCNVFKGGVNRLDPVFDNDNVQDISKIHTNTIIGNNTRNQIKDAFEQSKTILKPSYDFTFDNDTYCKQCAFLKK